MNIPKKKIINPLTVIAIFAAISETSAAVSLPFLDNKEKELYIWFLISFPFYLLFLFFATLNFNYRSLYAPSDFGKGKHFLEVLDNADRGQRPDNLKDPPSGIGIQTSLSALQHVSLTEPLKNLHIVDARWLNKKMEFGAWIEKNLHPQGSPAQVIVFLTCTDSEALLKESALAHSKQTKNRNGTTLCIAYNLSSRGLTILDHSFYLARSR
ncbi:hypothetical protein ACYZTX_24650 [Pseudomonas sp. MDT1-17]